MKKKFFSFINKNYTISENDCFFFLCVQIVLKNLKNEIIKKVQAPNCEDIFYAGTGTQTPSSSLMFSKRGKKQGRISLRGKGFGIVLRSAISHFVIP